MNRFACFLVAALISAVCGCGPSKPADLPPLHPVKLTITQGGAPLADAVVSLMPTSSSLTNYGISDKTNASGVVDPQTKSNTKQWPGVPEGTYTLLISKKSVPALDPAVDEYATDPAERAKLEQAQAKQSEDTVETVALEFSQFSQAKHQITVTKDGLKDTIDVGAAVSVPLSQAIPSSSSH